MGVQISENSYRQARTNISFFNCISKKNVLAISLFFCFFSYVSAQKTYQKNYYINAILKSEGWTKSNQKTGYWKFYYENGVLKKEGSFTKGIATKYWYFYRLDATIEKEGHYINGTKNKWWLFYDDMEVINHKCQLKDNQKNGYCLIYKNEKIVSARKYKAGKKVNEWTDYKSFKRENNLRDLK